MTFSKIALFVAGIVGLSSLTAAADELADIKARGTLVCGVIGISEPYGYVNPKTQEVEGYEVDLCSKLAERLGVKAEPKVTSSEARLPELLQGRVDVLAALITYSAERAKQIDYSNSYLVEPFRYLVRADSGIKDFSQLETARIANVKGSLLEKVTKERFPGATNISFEDQSAAFLALQQGKAVALAGRDTTLKALQNRAGDGAAPTEFVQEPLLVQRTGFGLRKGEEPLLKEINAFLTDLEASGEAQKLFDKWMGKDSAFKITRSFKVGDPIIN
ncbi:transporter substrate-binding domain-containing protein [Agrobacterium sp. LAD9]|uniref:transporter substrate-binding domain-containing protein n=1 Tax=Agrobacterium sp. LAD9 TaxID=2055153 RepID=UPI00186403C9|nr:transporter substrate-binding domain-containing protein [Agrobacterium sp. LAD9]